MASALKVKGHGLAQRGGWEAGVAGTSHKGLHLTERLPEAPRGEPHMGPSGRRGRQVSEQAAALGDRGRMGAGGRC